MERLEKMSEERLRRYFQRGAGRQAGYARVRSELRSLVTFRQLNLLDDNWQLAAICRWLKPQSYFKRRISLILRIDSLSWAIETSLNEG